MRIADVMTRDLPQLEPTATMRMAAMTMAETGARALPVCEGDLLIGVITDWDVTVAAAHAASLDETLVRDSMSTDVLSADPSASLLEASSMMGDRGLHHLCVSEEGSYRGMVHIDVDWTRTGDGIDSLSATFGAPI